MSATTYAANFEAAVAAADFDAEIAVYKADLARPDFIYYSCVANGFVFGDATTVYQTYTAADAARRMPTPTPMPTPADIDDVELCGCGKPAGGWHHDMQSGTLLHLRHPFVAVVAAEADSTLCADCRQPADDRCDECDLDICVTCSDRFHRHERLLPIRRNGAAFFDRQRAVAAFRKSTIESHLDRARRHAAELHGDLGDAGYSEHVQAEADALFN